MAKKRLSKDQKRKAKLAERARRSGPPSRDLAYTGNKYKRDDLVPVFMQVETGIYEMWVVSGRSFTDHTVRAALTHLVEGLRAGNLPPLDMEATPEIGPGSEEDAIVLHVRRRLHTFFEEVPHPGRDNLIGVLRTILGSVDVWSTPGRQSQGYLNYIEGFLRKAGVSVQAVSPEGLVEEEEEEDPDLELGRAWCLDREEIAHTRFQERAEELLAVGEYGRVAHLAQRLLGETDDPVAIKELSTLSLRAQEKMMR
jgi:hypothetical protein